MQMLDMVLWPMRLLLFVNPNGTVTVNTPNVTARFDRFGDTYFFPPPLILSIDLELSPLGIDKLTRRRGPVSSPVKWTV